MRGVPVRCSPASRRANGGSLQGVRDLPQDGLQDLRSLQGVRGARADGSKPAPPSLCAQAAFPSRELHPEREARAWHLGCARKIRERLIRRFSGIPIPAKSTIHGALDRHGLVERRGRVRRRAQGTELSSFGKNPNELWCTDFKGEFLLGNHQYCYPLTVTDHASRYLLTCEALSSTKEDYAFTVFERLFKERGLPANIRAAPFLPAKPSASKKCTTISGL